jgi:predicted kinase
MQMPTAIVLCGLPALGKSTRATQIAEMNLGAFVYSTDRYVENVAAHRGLTYSEVFADVIDQATKSMNGWLDMALRDRADIVWDQTNLTVKKREKILRRLKNAGYRVECECFVPPEPGHLDDLKAWKSRLNSRPGKIIPQHVLNSMYASYVLPTAQEGFDSVIYWNMHGAAIDADYNAQTSL